MEQFSTQHVSATAVLTAHMRALETERADHLIDDPLAACLVAASGIDMSAVTLSAVTGQRIFESNVVRTYWLDEHVLGAVGRECAQVVILGAGLDTRAARLELPAAVTVYEVDFAEVIDYKRGVYERERVAPRAVWRPVAADLTQPDTMMADLIGAGFDPRRPTAWLAEGVLFYLGEAESNELVATAARYSAAGSEFLAVHFGPGSQTETQSREMNNAAAASGFGFQSYVANPSRWMAGLGWASVVTTTIGRVGAEIGRPIGYAEPETVGAEITWLIHGFRID